MKKINKKILAIAITGVCFVGAGITVSQTVKKDVQSVSAEVIDAVVMDTYVKGETFTMPSSVTIQSGEKEYEATDGYVVFPNGNAYKKSAFELSDCGKYTLVYETTVDGTRYVAEKEFSVEESVYTVGVEASNVAYGELNEQFNGTWKYTEGLLVDLAEGDTLNYNRPINVYEREYTEFLAFNCMTDDLSVGTVTIRLTDCYDSSNYMEIQYLRPYENELYIRAGISGQATCAIYTVGSPDGYVYIDDVQYRVFRNKAGAMLPANRSAAVVAPKDPYCNNIKFAFDASNKDRLRLYGLTDTEPKNTLITEFNNEGIYPYTWDGFTTGDVFLSITASGFTNRETAPLQIAAIMDVSGEALKPEQYADTVAPTLTVDSTTDNAKIVTGAPVQVPAATAADISGVVGEVDYTVYYGYGTAAQRMISVSDGYFVPDAFGEYTVVYSATDRYGNVGTTTYTMFAEREGEQGIDFTYEKITGRSAGEFVSFNDYTAQGLNGEVSVSVTLTDADGKTASYKPTELVQLLRAGKYKVEYVYGDGIYSYTTAYEFEVKNSNLITFENELSVPKYFIKNASYTIESSNAYKYTDQAPAIAATQGYVSFDGGGYTPCDFAELKIEAASSVKLKLASKENAEVFVETGSIPVVDVGFGSKLTYGEYFVGNFDYEASHSYIRYSAKAEGDVTMDLINPLSLNNFYFAFGAVADNAFGGMTVTLTDFYDRSNKVSISFTQEKGISYMTVNEKTVRMTKTYNAGERNFIDYDGTQFSFNSTETIAYDPGFKTGKCLMSVTLNGASAGTPIDVYQVCNQVFRNLLSDTVDPLISVEAPERIGYIGDTFLVYAPTVTDILSPIVSKNVTVSVYFDGKPISSKDGILLSQITDFSRTYEVELTSYGDYLIIYNYTDGRNPMSHTEIVKVVDREKPVLTLNTTEISVSVGEDVLPVDCTASDNMTKTEDLTFWYIVVDERGVVVKTASGPFYLNKAGRYTVYVHCADEAGNATQATYTLQVK